MDSDNSVELKEPCTFEYRKPWIIKIIEEEVSKIEEKFLIKMDQRIIDHMKKEWENSKFNMSLYGLQKQIDKLTAQVECNSSIVSNLSMRINVDESEY